MRYPNSVRAVSTMASYQLDEEGPLRTIATIDAFAGRNPQHAYLRLQALNLLCRIDATADHSALLRHLQQELPSVDFTYTAGTMLSELFSASVASNCRTVPPASVVKLAQALHSNPRYAFDPVYNQFHEKLLAGIARFQGDDAATIRHLRAAISYQASTELNMMMVTALADASDFDAARNFIDDARAGAPANPLHAIQWRRELDQLSAYLDELEKVSQ
jgi:hypothetical protein